MQRIHNLIKYLREDGPGIFPAGEFQQANIRVIVAAVLVTYVGSYDEVGSRAFILCSLFLAFSSAQWLWTHRLPGKNVFRRLLAIGADLGTLSYALATTGALGAPWFGVYLWVVFGNGIRYGVPYLYFSALVSVIGFGAVIFLSSYWRANLGLGAGLFVALLLVPIYAARLLRHLNDALVAANAASRTKSQFVAKMNHELRTPLNGLVAAIDLLLRQNLSKDQSDLAVTAKTSATTLRVLIDQVLDLARMEAGQVAIETKPYDLYRTIKTVTTTLAMEFLEKGLRCEIFYDINVPRRLVGDEKHILQVLFNLLGNALKFTEKGGIFVRVRPVERDANTLVRVEVQDTGVGISPEDQERIWEKFLQADDSITRRFGGTGLGTALAKELIDAMGGTIGLDSEPGVGSTFWIELPLKPAEAAPLPKFDGACLLVIGVTSELRRHKVRALCERRGVKPIFAESAEDASQRLLIAVNEGPRYHAVLADTNESIADATRIAEVVRRQPNLRTLTLLAVAPDNRTVELLADAGYTTALSSLDNAAQMDQALGYLTSDENLVGQSTVPSAETPADEAAATQPEQTSKGAHILIADDYPPNLRLLRRILQSLGHTVESVTNGNEVLDKLDAAHFDLAILDMHMPEMSGIEAVKIYRACNPGNQFPFVMLTADATADARDAAEQVGVDELICKPFDIDALDECVMRLVQASGSTDSVEVVKERPPVVDLSTLNWLDDLTRDDDEKLGTLILEFFSAAKRTLKDLRTAAAEEDHRRVRDLAHILKGSAGSYGARQLFELARDLENQSMDEFPRECIARINELETSLQMSQGIYREYLDQHDRRARPS